MPEGHTLHRLARDMGELVGQPVSASSPQRRFPAEVVDGAQVAAVEAYGKHLLIDAVDVAVAPTVHVHLGLRGKWLRFSPVSGPGLPQVRLRLALPTVAWDLIAPSTCEVLEAAARSALLAKLGPDPLRPEADAVEARRRVQHYPGTVGAALMDQSVVAGIGNVFRAEILHACRIAPTRPAAAVADEEFADLWRTAQAMMSQGVDDGRIITVDVPGSALDRLAVPEEESRRVYKRASCYDCGTAVTVADLAGRTSYSCPRCQPD